MNEHPKPDRRSPGESYPGPGPDEHERDPYEHGQHSGEPPATGEDEDGDAPANQR